MSAHRRLETIAAWLEQALDAALQASMAKGASMMEMQAAVDVIGREGRKALKLVPRAALDEAGDRLHSKLSRAVEDAPVAALDRYRNLVLPRPAGMFANVKKHASAPIHDAPSASTLKCPYCGAARQQETLVCSFCARPIT